VQTRPKTVAEANTRALEIFIYWEIVRSRGKFGAKLDSGCQMPDAGKKLNSTSNKSIDTGY
jgi:hypothetical protein